MIWIWSLWAAFALAMIGLVTAMELAMLRSDVRGANGFTLLMTMLATTGGSVVVAIVTWLLGDFQTALIVLVVAAVLGWVAFKCALAVAGQGRKRLG